MQIYDATAAESNTMILSSRMRIERLSQASRLEALATRWNALDRGVPFRSYAWLESWWRAYGADPSNELQVLAVFADDGQLAGLAPWYRATVAGRVAIRFLGSGEVCSDYLTVLCRPGCEDDVTQSLADWLLAANQAGHAESLPWDVLELVGTDGQDLVIGALVKRLAEHNALVHRRRRPACWRVTLPADWNDYLATLSKSHRKQIRRLDRKYLETGRARLHVAQTHDELERGLALLVDLHQRRRASLGDRGSFSSERFAEFHRHAAEGLLAAGQLRLVWLTVDERPVAAEYQALGHDVVYAYQSGIEPEALEHEPGRLITIATLQQAIGESRRAFDFLRGDESYKAHWRAQPRETQDIRVVAPVPGARLRHGLWLAGDNVKAWIKRGLELSRTLGR